MQSHNGIRWVNHLSQFPYQFNRSGMDRTVNWNWILHFLFEVQMLQTRGRKDAWICPLLFPSGESNAIMLLNHGLVGSPGLWIWIKSWPWMLVFHSKGCHAGKKNQIYVHIWNTASTLKMVSDQKIRVCSLKQKEKNQIWTIYRSKAGRRSQW
jgi:hypothetical protein